MKTSIVRDRVVRGEFLPGEGEGEGEGDTLIVLAHGWNATGAKMRSMSDEARRLAPTADQFIAELDSGILSFGKPLQSAKRLAIDIARLDRERGYAKIIIVGHSAGALVARAAWLRAAGARERGDVGRRLHPWADKVERMVLMAAINRGWSDSVAISPLQKVQFGILAVWEFFTYGLLERWIGTSGFILEMRRGAPFISGLRLKWLAMAQQREKMPLTVQVLGTIDDIVSPKDNVDLIAGKDFVYLEAPASGHASMIRLDEPGVGAGRAEIFRLALVGDRAALDEANKAIEVADNLSDGLDDFDEDLSDAADKRLEVKRVVFVIHGIRDYGFWTKKIAGRAKRLGGGPALCRTVTSSYGFFPMGPFIFKALRRRRVEWLMDQYVRARALYPEAVFSYMGHSNGTALLAGAMKLSPAIRFDRVVFAGSVVRRDFDWRAFVGRGQVNAVMNYVATNDYIVAAFPKFLQRLPYADLGSAGFDGFDRFKDFEGAERKKVEQIEYVKGGHGAALRETFWDQAAHFLVDRDEDPVGGQPDVRVRRGWRLALANEVGSWVAMPFLLGLILAPGLLILLFPIWLALAPPGIEVLLAPLTQPWVIALSFLAYVWSVKAALTRL